MIIGKQRTDAMGAVSDDGNDEGCLEDLQLRVRCGMMRPESESARMLDVAWRKTCSYLIVMERAVYEVPSHMEDLFLPAPR